MTATGTQADGPGLPVIDWAAAARVAGRLTRPGPEAGRGEIARLVAELRTAAGRAARHVRRISGMSPAEGAAASLGTVHVVDRAGWARANAQMITVMLPALGRPAETSGAAATAGALQVGSVLALLSSRVLGQFDPYTTTPGRLILVAPNVLRSERTLGVSPQDFRLWVCLHEQTHALQFAAAPWLADHIRLRAARLVEGVGAHLPEQIGSVRDLGSLLGEQEEQLLDEITAVMSLLEGHADVVMDEVGPRVVPSVEHIRRVFDRRRNQPKPVDRLVRKVLGLDRKLDQYRTGAAFVRAVRDEVGLDGFNAVWAGPENLPRPAEIADAAAWVRRVHGDAGPGRHAAPGLATLAAPGLPNHAAPELPTQAPAGPPAQPAPHQDGDHP